MAGMQRLRRRADFLRVAAGRRKWVTPSLILQTLPQVDRSSGSERIGVGFTASQRVGNAVDRNRAKRRLRAAANALMARHAAPGFDYVLIARLETPRREYRALLADLEDALRHLGTWV
jgi:ribonuclease P protein component